MRLLFPSAQEAQSFIADRRRDKRAQVINRLLERPEFADFWALKWADVFKVNERFMNEDGVKDFHTWIHKQVAADRPLNEFVKELLVSTGDAKKVHQANFFRTMACWI